MNIKLHWIGSYDYVEIKITEGAGTIELGPLDKAKMRAVAAQFRAVADEIDPPDEGEKI